MPAGGRPNWRRAWMGAGTVLVTRTVQLDPGRNPDWTAEQVEAEVGSDGEVAENPRRVVQARYGLLGELLVGHGAYPWTVPMPLLVV